MCLQHTATHYITRHHTVKGYITAARLGLWFCWRELQGGVLRCRVQLGMWKQYANVLFAHAHAVCSAWCGLLQCVAVCFSVCSVLQCVALCCSQDTSPGAKSNSQEKKPTRHMCNMLQRTVTHCDTLRHTATHCNTLQHTATHGTHWNVPQTCCAII